VKSLSSSASSCAMLGMPPIVGVPAGGVYPPFTAPR